MRKINKILHLWIILAPLGLSSEVKKWNATIPGSAWNNANSWFPNAIPSNLDTALFESTTAFNRDEFLISVIAPVSIGRIDFNNQNPNCKYLISGPQSLHFNPVGSLGHIVVHKTNASIIDIEANLMLSKDLQISHFGSEKLFLKGSIAGKEKNIAIETTSTVEFAGDYNNNFSGWVTLNSGNLILNKKNGLNCIPADLNIESGSLIFQKNLQTAQKSRLVLQSTKGPSFVQIGNTHQAISQLYFQNSHFSSSLEIQEKGILEILSKDKDSISLCSHAKIYGSGKLILKEKDSGICVYGDKTKAEIGTPIDLNNSSHSISVIEKDSCLIFSSPISNGSITKLGLGSLQIEGEHSFAGKLSILEGVVKANPQNLQGSVENFAILEIETDKDSPLNMTITGTGKFIKTGNSKLQVESKNNFSGKTVVDQGTLSIQSDTLTGPIENNANLEFDQNFNGSFDQTIDGTGTITKLGNGSLHLSGENSFSGFVKVVSGNLIGDTKSLQGYVDNQSLVTIEQNFDGNLQATLQGPGTYVKQGLGTLSIAEENQTLGQVLIEQGTLELSHNQALGQSPITLEEKTSLKLGPEIKTENPVILDGKNIQISVPVGISKLEGIIEGVGFSKTGSGTLDLLGPTHVEKIILETGSLKVDTTILVDDIIQTEKKTILSGNGTILGSVNIEGILDVGQKTQNNLPMTNEQILEHFDISEKVKSPNDPKNEIYLVGDFTPAKTSSSLEILGDVFLNNSATVMIKMDPEKSTPLQIDGSFQINDATLVVLPQEGTYDLQKKFQLVSASSIDGLFSEIITPFPLIGVNVFSSNLTSQYFLNFSLEPKNFESLFPSGNLHQVASYLDFLKTSGCGNSQKILNALYNMTDQKQIEKALNQMHTGAFTDLSLAQSYDLLSIQGSIFNRLRANQRSCHTYTYQKTDLESKEESSKENQFEMILDIDASQRKKTTLWASFVGNINTQGNVDDYLGYTAQSPGVILGLDLAKDQNTLGLGLGYIYTDLDWKKNQGHGYMQNIYGIIYDQISNHIGFVSGQLVGGYTMYDTDRSICFGPKKLIKLSPHASFNGYEGSFDLKAGLFVPVKHTTFIPFLGLDYSCIYQNSFSEKNASALNINGKNHVADLLTSELGWEWSFCQVKDLTKMKGFLHLSAVYEHRFYGKYEKGKFSCGKSFEVSGYYPNRYLGSIGAGMSINHKQGTLSIAYQAKAGSDFINQDLTINFSWEF